MPIDPLELKLATRTYATTILKGVFGAVRDASPDHWGRRVIEKYAGKTELGEVDYLLYSPDDRAGALGFGLNREPPAPRRKFNRAMALERLQTFADAIIADEDLPEGSDAEQRQQAQDLMLHGTSMGGARPKTVVEDDAGLWIAKFNRPDDKWNYARVERAMLVLARECGLQASESKVATIGDRRRPICEALRPAEDGKRLPPGTYAQRPNVAAGGRHPPGPQQVVLRPPCGRATAPILTAADGRPRTFPAHVF